MKRIILLTLCLILSGSSFADKGGVPNGGNGNPGKAVSTQPAKFDKSNIGKVSNPPGLENKGMPPGLSKKNKTPAGWSKGEKTGWDQDKDRDEGFVRRTWNDFLGLFR